MMTKMKMLFHAVCLCGVAVIAQTAMTQDETLPQLDDGAPFTRPATDTQNPLNPDTVSDSPEPEFRPIPIQDQFDDAPRPRLNTERSVPQSFATFPDGQPLTNTRPMRARRITRNVFETVYEPIPNEELEASKRLQDALQAFKLAEDETARKSASDVIQQQLTTQFEADLKRREKELAEVEKRVKSLREQLNKRQAAQTDIIHLRLQTLVNDASGLGFPDVSLPALSGTETMQSYPSEYRPGTVQVYDETHDPCFNPVDAIP